MYTRPFRVTVAKGRIIPIDSPGSDELEVQEALMNWAQWCRTPQGRARCMSAEGRYEPEAGNVWDGTVLRKYINTLSAEQVNAALLLIIEQYRTALGLRYYSRVSDWAICKKVHVRPADYGALMRRSRLSLRAVLQTVDDVDIIRPDNLTLPSNDAQDAQAGRPIPKGNGQQSVECQADQPDLVRIRDAPPLPSAVSAISTDAENQSPHRARRTTGRRGRKAADRSN